MRKSFSILVLLLAFHIQGTAAVEFNPKEKAIIYTHAINVLGNYQGMINLMGESAVTDIGKAKSNSESFLDLFVNRQVLIYNDLDPSHKLSEFYEAETYASNIMLWYPDGIAISLDLANAKVSNIMSHDENVFSIDVLVTKSINGNYLNQALNKNSEEITFRIAFTYENKTPSKFKIAGIRNASSNTVVDFSKALKEVNNLNLGSEEIAKITSEIKTVIHDYTNFLSLLGDPDEAADDKVFYKESFRKLFKNADIKVYNDLGPDAKTSLISVEDYLKNYVADFPNGIKNLSINADSAKSGNIMKADDGSFYTYTDATKFFSGNYKGKELFRKAFPLVFKISFTASGKTYSDFKINSVDVSSKDFFKAEAGATSTQKPDIKISPVTRKGLALSVSGSAGQTIMTNKNITGLTIATDAVAWQSSPLYGYSGAAGISYFLSDNLAIETGLGLTQYKAKFSLNGTFTDINLTADDNDYLFYKVITAAYDSVVTASYLSVPVMLSYTSGKPGSIGFYTEGGFNVSIPLSVTYANKGSYEYAGDYPSKVFGDGLVTIPEKGFYSRQDINQTGKTSMKGINISLSASAGINFPLGYYSSVMAGPVINLGFSDIMGGSKTYHDIFGNPHNHLATKVNFIGFKLCFTYKL